MRRIRRNRNRKLTKKLFRGIRRVAITVMLIALAVMFLPGMELYARGSHEEPATYKYYTDIRVMRGDTLSSIADRFYSLEFPSKAAYIKEVMFINHLSSDRIDAGEYIIVPYYSEEIK